MSTAERTREVLKTGCYVYGIVPGDVETTADARGLGDRPVRVVRQGEIAALVSDIGLDDPIGTPEDLAAHEALLDAVVTEAPVLPIRFGAVLASADDVAQDLLAANHDQFLAALRELEGHAEYIVRGRYEERAVLREVVAEDRDAAALREQIRGRPEEATRDLRIRLGEIIHNAIEAKRDADTRRAVEALSAHAVADAVRQPTHELDAVHVAFLVGESERTEFEDAVSGLARDWEGRIEPRLLGPLAPYDFVVTP